MADLLLPDGLDALRKELELGDIMRLIERTARWVDPETFRLLPLWYPEYARRTYLYKHDWSKLRVNTSRLTGQIVDKLEGNGHANKALTHALGLRSDERPNWSCCHIWGIDDPFFREANAVVQDRRFFSCIANMVLLPTPLKAFTDAIAEVKVMLRICARHLYGWHCEHDSLQQGVAAMKRWRRWDAYPRSWPRKIGASMPLGVVPINEGIRKSAIARLARIRRDLISSGPHYPRKEVREALDYWQIKI